MCCVFSFLVLHLCQENPIQDRKIFLEILSQFIVRDFVACRQTGANYLPDPCQLLESSSTCLRLQSYRVGIEKGQKQEKDSKSESHGKVSPSLTWKMMETWPGLLLYLALSAIFSHVTLGAISMILVCMHSLGFWLLAFFKCLLALCDCKFWGVPAFSHV